MTPAADDGAPEPGSDRTAAELADVLVGLAERGLLRATYDPQSRYPLWFDSPPAGAGTGRRRMTPPPHRLSG